MPADFRAEAVISIGVTIFSIGLFFRLFLSIFRRRDAGRGRKSKKGSKFSAALRLADDGRVRFEFPPRVDAPCPTCGTGRVIRGKRSLGCSRWREGCDWRG